VNRRLLLGFSAIALHSLLVATARLPRYDALAFVPVAFFFARAVHDLASQRRWLAYAFFFFAFGAAVYANQLITGVEGRHALVGGIIPWSDAEGFLSNAWRAQSGLPFSTAVTATAMRPLYPLTFAFTLAASGLNVKVAIGAYAAVAALLSTTIVNALAARTNARGAAAIAIVLAFYVRRYLFVIGTESLGFIAGLVAFWLFLSSLDALSSPSEGRRRLAIGLPGAFLVLGLALAARPGPMLAIPLLLFWIFRRSARAFRWRLAGGCALAFAIALGLNALVIRTTGEKSGVTGGEFPPILYGAIHGEDYTYLGQTHPEIAHLPQNERIGGTLGLIGSEVRAQPWLALGFLGGGGAFLVGPHGLFSLVFYAPDDAAFEGKDPLPAKLTRVVNQLGPYRILNLLAMALVATAFVGGVLARAVRYVRHRTADPLTEAAVVILAGAAVSACLTPPWITEGAQLQASTLAFLALLPWPMASPSSELASVPTSARFRALIPTLAGAWLLASFVYCVTRRSAIPERACDPDRAMRLEPSMLVRVRGYGEGGYTLDRMEANLRFVAKHNPLLTRPLVKAAAPGVGIQMVFDGCAQRAAILVDDADALAAQGRGWRRVLATPVDTAGRIFGHASFAP
jgi:hypothetical protein